MTGAIDELSLRTRARNCLRRAGITTVSELVTWTGRELLHDVRNLGEGTLTEITAALAAHGLALREWAPSTGARHDCPSCGRDISIRRDGLMRAHSAPGTARWCPGSRRAPVMLQPVA